MPEMNPTNPNAALDAARTKPCADARADLLLRALQRTRIVLYTAMMDGTVKNTLWANADQNLLDYLDQEIATASNAVPAMNTGCSSSSSDLEASLWGLVSRPSAFERLIYSEK